jgi:hypothetical protein
MKKLLREITRACAAEGVELIEVGQHRSHYRAKVRGRKAPVTITVACSPRDRDVTIKNFRRDLVKYA